MLSEMMSALYGRQTAGADFRDYFEHCLTATPEVPMIRGLKEPTAYRKKDGTAVVTHHIDDDRGVALRP